MSADFELGYFHHSDSHNSFFILQIFLNVHNIVHKNSTVCTFKYLICKIHVFLLIFTQFTMPHYKYIIDLCKKNCIKYYQQNLAATQYVPEWLDTKRIHNECFVVVRRCSGNCRKPTAGATWALRWALRWAAPLQSG